MKNFQRSIFALILCFLPSFNIFSQENIAYNYGQVAIGGGGYIVGMQVHPTDEDIRYYRTDVGGAYRYNAVTESLEQLIFVDRSQKDYYGVAGIALDPNNRDKLILAVGRKCIDSQTAILVSSDRGRTWDKEITPADLGAQIYFAANGGRGCSGGGDDKDRQGNPIILNPNNNNELIIGSRGTGLWKLNLNTETFTQLGAGVIPNNVHPNSIRTIEFHPTQTDMILIGYAGQGIFTGDLTNNTFEKISTHVDLNDVSDLSISKDGDYALFACKFKGIYRCNDFMAANRVWSLSLAYNGPQNGEGFLTVTCSPHENGEAVTIYSRWEALSSFQSTADSGDSWTSADGELSDNIYPYKRNGHGSHTSQLAFSPTDANKLFLTSWFTTMETDNWKVNNIAWSNAKSKGHEEIVCTDLESFPITSAGNFLIAGSGDHSGFIKNNIDQFDYPSELIRDLADSGSEMFKGSNYAYCITNPDYLYAITLLQWDDPSNKAQLSISSDGGDTFIRSTGFPENEGKATIAVSANNERLIVIANKVGVYYSNDGGDSFAPSVNTNINVATCADASAIVPTGTGTIGGVINTSVFASQKLIASDKELGCLFYFYNTSEGSFHVSTNGGQSFFKVNEGLPTLSSQFHHKTRIITVPGHPMHVWINFDNDLYFSMDAGQNFSRISSVTKARILSVGPKSGNAYPYLFLYGRITGEVDHNFYLSQDMGATWSRINDPNTGQQWGNVNVMASDMNVPGRFYFGTGGLGIFSGEPSNALAIDDVKLTSEVYGHNARLKMQLFNTDRMKSIDIEKSVDNMDYKVINKISNPDVGPISFVDFNFIESAYYRLSYEFGDGQKKYSNISFLSKTDERLLRTTWHDDVLNIFLRDEYNYNISIYAFDGRLIHNNNYFGRNIKMPINYSGLFFLKIVDLDEHRVIEKVLGNF